MNKEQAEQCQAMTEQDKNCKKENILLYYTSLETACKILSNFKIRMTPLKDSKDPLEAMLAFQALTEINSREPPIDFAEGVQIVCLARASFPVCTNLHDAFEAGGGVPSYTVLKQVMFYNYGNYGDGVCFILDREKFENENNLPSREIKYVAHPYTKICEALNKFSYPEHRTDVDLYNIFRYKHESFEFENELRFFQKAPQQCQNRCHCCVSIATSCLGVCLGPRLTSQYLPHNAENIEGLFSQVICQITSNKKQLYGVDFNNNLVGYKYNVPDISPMKEPIACFAPTDWSFPPTAET
jgi:hypothetical protein